MPDEHHRIGRFGEDHRADPDSLAPEDEESAVGPEGPTVDVVLRALSVVPFLLVAALGLIGAVSWILIILLGIGSSEPIWRSVRGLSLSDILWQLLLAVLTGMVPVLLTLAASWAAAHGFRESSGRPFWTAVEGVWGLAGLGLVYVDRARGEWLDAIGLSRSDWWFAFAVVAFAMIIAGMRLRRAPTADGSR
ncbi:MAG: hypothetical protein GX624_01395 [Actinobacteria bacterium]|nr:hypothetical protein [Actinomycetota bacterium]